MTDQHPITPPPELVAQWLGEYFGTTVTGEISDVEHVMATRAARWGADQELEACCEWLDEIGPIEIRLCGNDLRIDRRPKLKSRKQRALDALAQMEDQYLSAELATEIRQALEELPDD